MRHKHRQAHPRAYCNARACNERAAAAFARPQLRRSIATEGDDDDSSRRHPSAEQLPHAVVEEVCGWWTGCVVLVTSHSHMSHIHVFLTLDS
jgi:hypothetical protein